MIADRLSEWKRYFDGPVWSRAFTYLESLGPDSDPVDYVELDSFGLFARVMQYPTRGPEEAILEAHDRYIDIQMSLVNGERIDWFPREPLTVRTPYDQEKDVILFERDTPPAASITNTPGVFSVFYPNDAHMAQLVVDGRSVETVTKAVVKVPLARVVEEPRL